MITFSGQRATSSIYTCDGRAQATEFRIQIYQFKCDCTVFVIDGRLLHRRSICSRTATETSTYTAHANDARTMSQSTRGGSENLMRTTRTHISVSCCAEGVSQNTIDKWMLPINNNYSGRSTSRYTCSATREEQSTSTESTNSHNRCNHCLPNWWTKSEK